MITARDFHVLHQAETITFDCVMNAGFLEIFQQLGKMLFDQAGVLDNGIAKRPGCSLVHSMISAKEYVKKLVKSFLGMTDPIHDGITVGPCMFFQNLCVQVHSLQINNFSHKKMMTLLRMIFVVVSIAWLMGCGVRKHSGVSLVVQTDFGEKDGAVAAMKGVAKEVDATLDIVDLTHEIPAFNIWEAGYRLSQVVPYWPANTVFVSVVDPGVGTSRRSIVVRTKKDHYIVTPDNGTITLLAALEGIGEVREIDERVNRRPGSDSSFTFHGRDVYMYTAARLASGKIRFDQLGPVLKSGLQTISYQAPVLDENGLTGNIPVLDPQYGNVWTNIPDSFVRRAGIRNGDSVLVNISYRDSVVYSGKLAFVNTFGDVANGQPLAYLNSLMNFSLAINMGNFADQFRVLSGPDWTIHIEK